jgi:AcrR family transcriptional regulator
MSSGTEPAEVQLPWWPEPRERTPAREPLDRELIVSTAIRIADQEGLEALSMRRLAQELGSGATSLYRHVANKDELLDLAVDAVLGEVPLADDSTLDWQQRTGDLARGIRTTLRRHPGVAMLFGFRVTRGPNALAIADRLLGILRSAGLEGAQLGLAYQAVTTWAVAFGAIDSRDVARPATERQTSAQQHDMIEQMLAALPPDRYPNVVAAFTFGAEMTADAQFAYGLEALIAGIAAGLPGSPSTV